MKFIRNKKKAILLKRKFNIIAFKAKHNMVIDNTFSEGVVLEEIETIKEMNRDERKAEGK